MFCRGDLQEETELTIDFDPGLIDFDVVSIDFVDFVVCHKVAISGALPDSSRKEMTHKFPIPMLIIGGLGGVLMVLGMVFTLIGTGGEPNMINILFGAFTTGAGFLLIRRTLNNRKVLLGNV